MRSELVRFVLNAHLVSLDIRKSAPGRGVWLCPSADCFDLAVSKKLLVRALHRKKTEAGLMSVGMTPGLRCEFKNLIGSGEGTSGEDPDIRAGETARDVKQRASQQM